MASKQSDSVTSSELQNSGNNYIEEVNDQGSTQSSLTPSLTEGKLHGIIVILIANHYNAIA